MKALTFYAAGTWQVTVEAQFDDEPTGTHPLPLCDAQSSKVAVVYAAAKVIGKLGVALPATIFDQRHWRVAGPRKWQFTGARPRIV